MEKNNLEKKIVTFAVAGLVGTGIVTTGIASYLLNQPPETMLSGKAVANLILLCESPMVVGVIPMFLNSIKETYKEFSKNYSGN